MAKTIDPSKTTWRAGYPWDQWLDGQAWLLTRGEDFEVTPRAMAVTANLTATRRGLKVRTHVDKEAETVTIQRVTG